MVADLVTPDIVDRLEVIDIGHHQRHRQAFLLRAFEQFDDILFEGAPRAQPGQPVHLGLFAHRLDLVVDARTDQRDGRH